MHRSEIEQWEADRRRLWIEVCVAVAGANNSTVSDSIINWADKALKTFDARFPRPIVKEPT